MNRYPLEIVGVGCYIPERGKAPKNSTQSDMSKGAITNALMDAKMSVNDIDVIINASETIEKFIPEGATLMQGAMGWGDIGIPCFTVQNGWNGFIQALETCISFGISKRYQNILVVISELYSHIINEEDNYLKDSSVALILNVKQKDEEKNYAFYPSIYNYNNIDVVKSLFSIANIEAGKKGDELCISYQMNELEEKAIHFLKTDAQGYSGKMGSADFVIAQYLGDKYNEALSEVFKGSKVINDEQFAGCGTNEILLNYHKAIKDGIIQSGNSVIFCCTGPGICSSIIKIVC